MARRMVTDEDGRKSVGPAGFRALIVVVSSNARSLHEGRAAAASYRGGVNLCVRKGVVNQLTSCEDRLKTAPLGSVNRAVQRVD
jgi:hypothetical protein